MAILFIVNPKLKTHRKDALRQEIEKYFTDENYCFFDDYVRNFPREESKKYNHFVAVGGDGTVYQTINLMMQTKARKFSLIPAGSGNDFARTLGLKGDVEEILKGIKAASPRDMDIGRWNERYFINIASVGLDADVNALNTSEHKEMGSISYSLKLFDAVKNYRFRKISLEDCREEEWTIFTFGNGKYYGGGFPIFKEADPFSGKLLFLGAGKSRLPYVIPFLACLFVGKDQLFQKDMVRKTIDSMEFELLEEANVNLDGENFYERGPVKVEIFPGEIQYIGPLNL